jgi:hypothetical protein
LDWTETSSRKTSTCPQKIEDSIDVPAVKKSNLLRA